MKRSITVQDIEIQNIILNISGVVFFFQVVQTIRFLVSGEKF